MIALRLPLTLATALALCACASAPDGEYPSLGIREAEYASGQVPRPTGACVDGVVGEAPRSEGQMMPAEPATPLPPPPTPVLSNDLLVRIAQLLDQARTAHAQFEGALPATREAVRSRGSVGSKAWGRAEVAYANLRSIRARTAIPLAELDTMVATRSVAGEPVGEVIEARDAAARLIDQQDAALAELLPR